MLKAVILQTGNTGRALGFALMAAVDAFILRLTN